MSISVKEAPAGNKLTTDLGPFVRDIKKALEGTGVDLSPLDRITAEELDRLTPEALQQKVMKDESGPISLETHPPNFHELLGWLRRRAAKGLAE